MIAVYVLVSARLSEKWLSKTMFSRKKISLPDAQISQNYTSYYQLTFSESNRLIVSVICAWSSIKAISITTKYSKTGAAWSRTTEPQAAHRMKPSARGRLWSDLIRKSDRKCSTWRMRRRFAAVLSALSASMLMLFSFPWKDLTTFLFWIKTRKSRSTYQFVITLKLLLRVRCVT